jgi:hypothetical protein
MAEETVRSRAGSAAKSLLAWVIILGLLGAVGYLIAERNARTWALVPEEGRLVVAKGLFLPLGRATFKTSDPVLARVYAPLVPPPGKALPEEHSYLDQSDLDRALYDLLSAWARDDIMTGDPSRLERGLGYLERALDLPALSAAQRDGLTALRAESGYYEARRLLERARAELSEAAEKLRLSAGSRSAHAVDAQTLLHELEPAVEATASAVRAAGGSVRPPPAEAQPQATVPQAQDGARPQ